MLYTQSKFSTPLLIRSCIAYQSGSFNAYIVSPSSIHQSSISSLQLALRTLRPNLNDELPKLRSILHILKQTIDILQIINALHSPVNQRLEILLIDKLDQLGKLLPRTHRAATKLDILEHGWHSPCHLGRDRHSVLGDDAAVLLKCKKDSCRKCD